MFQSVIFLVLVKEVYNKIILFKIIHIRQPPCRQRKTALRCGGIPCSVSLNLLIKLKKVHLFSTCSSSTILQNGCYALPLICFLSSYQSYKLSFSKSPPLAYLNRNSEIFVVRTTVSSSP